MQILAQAEAQTILSPHMEKLQACMQSAWLSWEEGQRVAPRLWVPLSARTRASFIHDHIRREAKERFEGVPNVWISEARGFLQINLEDRLLGRFKKLDRYQRASNVQTRQQVLYGMQQPLPGIPDLTRINIGYELNLFQTSIKDYWVTCPQGKVLVWSFAFQRPEAMVLLVPSVEDAPAHSKSRVRRKGTQAEAGSADQDTEKTAGQ